MRKKNIQVTADTLIVDCDLPMRVKALSLWGDIKTVGDLIKEGPENLLKYRNLELNP